MIVDGKMHYGSHGIVGGVRHGVIRIAKSEERRGEGKKSFTSRTLEELAAKHRILKGAPRSVAISICIVNIITVLDPDIVVLGGGIESGSLNLILIRKSVRAHILSACKENAYRERRAW